MTVRALPVVVPAPPDRPKIGSPEHPMRIATRRIAFEPAYWNAAEATRVASFFDELAPTWTDRFGRDEMRPLIDALERGGPFGSRCLEVGAGTGSATKLLLEHFATVIALDVSAEMLARFIVANAAKLLADGAALPVPDASVDAIVLVNAFLFPREYDRVLARNGVIIWVNTLADDTPIHMPIADVVAALPGTWNAIASHAGWGSWGVVRRG
jgi:ubiquinone/menaquinone biosynthesis C-methylase UbiE